MTRKEFLNTMVKSIFGYSIIEFKEIQNNNVRYEKTGTLIKDCTYTQHYHKKIEELICSIFDKNVKIFKIGVKDKLIKMYQENARNFLNYIYKYDSKEKIGNNLNYLLLSNLEDLDYIYRFIIIDEIFYVEECNKECGSDNFDDSINKIIKMIEYQFEEIRRRKFYNAITDPEYNKIEIEDEVFYKSSELGKRYANIKEYLKIKKCDFIILNDNNVVDFQQNTIYRYTGECFFEVGEHNEIITYFKYNNRKIQSYTSTHNWLNMSILCNYVHAGASRYFNCYFFYDQGRMFKFLQISEADITAEI